jgi:hypothetical protein
MLLFPRVQIERFRSTKSLFGINDNKVAVLTELTAERRGTVIKALCSPEIYRTLDIKHFHHSDALFCLKIIVAWKADGTDCQLKLKLIYFKVKKN